MVQEDGDGLFHVRSFGRDRLFLLLCKGRSASFRKIRNLADFLVVTNCPDQGPRGAALVLKLIISCVISVFFKETKGKRCYFDH